MHSWIIVLNYPRNVDIFVHCALTSSLSVRYGLMKSGVFSVIPSSWDIWERWNEAREGQRWRMWQKMRGGRRERTLVLLQRRTCALPRCCGRFHLLAEMTNERRNKQKTSVHCLPCSALPTMQRGARGAGRRDEMAAEAWTSRSCQLLPP